MIKKNSSSVGWSCKAVYLLFLAAAMLLAGCGNGNSSNTTSNNAAPTGNSDTYTVDEGANLIVSIAIGVLANDTDPESQPLTAILVDNVQHGTLTLNADGSFSYTHDGSEQPVTDGFTYKANDGSANSSLTPVTININPVNDPPVANNDANATDEDTILIVPASGVLANDTDAELDPLTVTAFDATSTNGAVVNVNNDGSFSYDPTGAAGLQSLSAGGQTVDSFNYTVSDGNGGNAMATVSITVSGVNDAPVASASCGTTRQQQNHLGTLIGTDVETPALLSFSLGADGSGGAGPIATAKGQVSITNTTTGTYTYTPNNPGTRGSDSFIFRVDDPDGGFATATETIIIDETIMPLGDSITRGSFGGGTPAPKDKIGYRKPLYDSLIAAGYSFDFVGTMPDGNDPVYQPFDFDSEGHGGWSATEIAFGRAGGYPTDGVRAWLDTNPADIILLHIGTNGLASDPTPVQNILNEIDTWEGSAVGNPVTVILARITDQNPINPVVTTFNDNVVAMALDRVNNPLNPAFPDDIIIVDQQSALNYPADLTDAVHPNPTGYGKMAPVWQAPLTGLLQKCP